jgi:hypothetical protein
VRFTPFFELLRLSKEARQKRLELDNRLGVSGDLFEQAVQFGFLEDAAGRGCRGRSGLDRLTFPFGLGRGLDLRDGSE